jgi:hypothetical protein
MDEDGSSRRHTVYGNTAKEARDKAAEVRARLRANLPAKDRKITLGEFTAEWIDSSLEASDRKATTKNLYGTMAHTHHRCQDRRETARQTPAIPHRRVDG